MKITCRVTLDMNRREFHLIKRECSLTAVRFDLGFELPMRIM